MSLILRYQEHYQMLGSLRNFVESGIMLSSVNFWRDSFQGYKEFEIIENREKFLASNSQFFENDFINQFFLEEFPESEVRIGMSEASTIMDIIHDKEGDETYNLFIDCILAYATEIAKASKEDWLALIGLKDNISDKEVVFLNNLNTLLRNS